MITENDIVSSVCKVMGIEESSLVGKVRTNYLAFARMLVAYFCRKETFMSTIQIGNIINRDHSTILYYLRKDKDETKYNPDYRRWKMETQQSLDEKDKKPRYIRGFLLLRNI